MNPTAHGWARRWGQGMPVAAVAMLLVCSLTAAAGEPNAEVLPPGTAVYPQPGVTAEVLGHLPAATRVEVVFTIRGSGGEWSQILLSSGETGYVPDRTLRHLKSPQRWRAVEAPSPAFEVRLERAGGAYLVPARINGHGTTFLVVDTGASSVILTEEFARGLGIEYADKPPLTVLTVNGRTQGYLISLESLYIPDETGMGLPRVGAVVSELPGFPPQIGGLLGQTFLRHFRVTIDSNRHVMHLERIP